MQEDSGTSVTFRRATRAAWLLWLCNAWHVLLHIVWASWGRAGCSECHNSNSGISSCLMSQFTAGRCLDGDLQVACCTVCDSVTMPMPDVICPVRCLRRAPTRWWCMMLPATPTSAPSRLAALLRVLATSTCSARPDPAFSSPFTFF